MTTPRWRTPPPIPNGSASELDLNDPEIREIVGLYVDRLPRDFERLQSAWRSRDWDDLAKQVHSLKGSAAMTGFPMLSQAAQIWKNSFNAAMNGASQAMQELKALGQRVQRPEELVAACC